MIPVLIFVYAVFGLWSAERFRNMPQKIDMISWGLYASIVLLWPLYWIVYAIVADEPEIENGEDDNESESN